MKPIIRVSVGHDGAHFAADWDLEKIEVQEILNDGEDIYGPTLQFKERSFRHKSCPGWFMGFEIFSVSLVKNTLAR